MFQFPVEVWGSAPPASPLRLKKARQDSLLKAHGLSRYSDILHQDLYRWRETNNSPKFSSLPSALEEEEKEREMVASRRRIASGSSNGKTKLKDIWKISKLKDFITGKSKNKDRSPPEFDGLDISPSELSGSPSMREPERSILNRLNRSGGEPKKSVRWADEASSSPHGLNLSTINEEGHPRNLYDLALDPEEPDAFLEFDDDDVGEHEEDSESHGSPSDSWQPISCAISSFSDSELSRHPVNCTCCDERNALLNNLRSPDAGFHSPESSSQSAAECAANAAALSLAAQQAAAFSIRSSSGVSSINFNSGSPSSYLPLKLPRLASTPSLLPSQCSEFPFVISKSGVKHQTSSTSTSASTVAQLRHPRAVEQP